MSDTTELLEPGQKKGQPKATPVLFLAFPILLVLGIQAKPNAAVVLPLPLPV